MSKEKQEHCCSACGIDYSVYTALLEACRAIATDFDLGEHDIKESMKQVRAAIAAAEGKV